MREFLIECRKNKGLTQLELAKQLGISEIYVRKLEHGTRNPSVNTMLKYEKFFGVSMKKLFPDIFFTNKDTFRIKNLA